MNDFRCLRSVFNKIPENQNFDREGPFRAVATHQRMEFPMKLAALALAFALTGLVTPLTADACGMRKVRFSGPIEMVADTQLKQGQQAEQKGDLRAAIRHYERAMNARGRSVVRVDAAVRAAALHQKLGNTKRAIARLTRGVAIDDTHFGARVTLGRLLAESAPAEALPHLEAARDLDRLDADVYTDLAITHARLGQRDAAERALAAAKGLGASPDRVIAAEKALATGGVAVL